MRFAELRELGELWRLQQHVLADGDPVAYGDHVCLHQHRDVCRLELEPDAGVLAQHQRHRMLLLLVMRRV